MTTDIHVNSKPAGNTWMRLTVHLNGPSVQFADPKKEFKEVNGKKIKSKRSIMNTLTFRHIKESDVHAIINGVKHKYSNLEKSKNMPDGIKWYMSRMK